MKHSATGAVTIEVDGTSYVTSSHIEDALGISRQTLWRWRNSGKVPAGHVYRERVVFTAEEAEEVYEYANRVRPAPARTPRQITLFRKAKE